MENPEGFPNRNLSLANPLAAKTAGDLPLLLRRTADMIEELGLGSREILDLTVSQDATEFGPWWSVHLYWSRG